MTLVVEDGTGKTDADSYISIADADTYFANRTNPSNWADTAATVILYMAVNPTDGETVVVNGKTYTFKDTLGGVDGQVLIGDAVTDTQTNLVAAINLTGSPEAGLYDPATTLHSTVSAAAFSSNACTLSAKTGGTDGNAYTAVETMADSGNVFSASTFSGGVDDKEVYLRMATEYLDMHYALRWKGEKTNYDQTLQWPRINVVDENDITIDCDEMPTRLLRATCEVALRIAGDSDNELLGDLTDAGDIRRYSVKAGPITETTEYTGAGNPQQSFYQKVDALLRGLLQPPGQILLG